MADSNERQLYNKYTAPSSSKPKERKNKTKQISSSFHIHCNLFQMKKKKKKLHVYKIGTVHGLIFPSDLSSSPLFKK